MTMSKKSEAPLKKPLVSQRNYEPQTGYEDYTGVISKAVPDQAYTVQEIFAKFRAGVRLPIERDTYYSGTEDFDHPDGFEYLDIVDYHEQLGVIEKYESKQGRAAAKPMEPAGLEPAESQSGGIGFEAANKP